MHKTDMAVARRLIYTTAHEYITNSLRRFRLISANLFARVDNKYAHLYDIHGRDKHCIRNLLIRACKHRGYFH